MSIYLLLKEVLAWIKHPVFASPYHSAKDKLRVLSQLLILDLVLALMFSGILYLIDLYLIVLDAPVVDDSWITILIISALVVPVFEEIIFRLPLRYERNYVFRLLDLVFKGLFKKHWHSYFKYFLYFMILAFGLMHVSNYNNTGLAFFIMSPLIVGSQIVGGVFMSFERVKLGFFWSVAHHSIFNAVVILFSSLEMLYLAP